MRTPTIGSRFVSLLLVLALLCALLPTSPALAGWVGSGDAVGGAKVRLASLMAREDVARTLEGLGINSAEAARRVDGLTAAEAQRMVDRFDQLPAGQDAVGAIVGAALLVFIVLLVTDLLGLTDVFPFVKKTVR